MATLTDLTKNTLEWQRALKFAGYYTGKLDGITGPLTRAAEAKWHAAHEAIKREIGEVDARSEACLLTLQPIFASPMREILVELRKLGDWKIIHGLRSYAEQNALYAQGRTKSGNKVTNAKGGQSKHNFGTAGDFCLFVNGKDTYSPDSGAKSIYNPIRDLVAKHPGLTWGGTWKSPYDPAHVELTTVPIAQLNAAYTNGSSQLSQLRR